MKRHFILLLMLILTGISTGVAIHYFQSIQEIQKECEEKSEENVNKGMIIDLLSGHMKMLYENNERILPDFTLLDSEQKEIKYSDLIDNKTKVIFKFSSTNCSSCINFGLESIIKFIKMMQQDQVVIIAEHSNRRQLQALMNSMNINIPVYRVIEKKIFQDILKDENIPFIFVTDKSRMIKDLFIPIKELPDYSDIYNRIILKKYFKQEKER